MNKVSVCIEMIYTEYPFLERIRRAAQQGFDAIEFWNWDNKDMFPIREEIIKTGIKIAAFQANMGGTLIHPAQRDNFVAGIQKSIEKAQEMGVSTLLLTTDELKEDRSVRFQFPELSPDEKYLSVLDGLKVLAPLAERAHVTLALEPLNTYVDHPGYFLNHSEMGSNLIREVGSPNICLLFDIYHMQVMEGNLISSLTRNLDTIGYVHVADVPGRHQPGTGEINYKNVFRALERAGYEGYIGLEFAPTIPSEQAAYDTLSTIRS
jgi:hydroxypyruvate isomerase